MGSWATKITGNTLTATEFNLVADEIENQETAGSESPSAGSSDQLAKSIVNNVGNADYYTDGGSANAYVLSVVSPNKAPTSYRVGMKIRFRTSNANTGASTVNVASLGNKNIKKQDGSTDIDAGDISSSLENEAVYDGTSFRLKNKVEDSTVSVQGVNFINKYWMWGFIPISGSTPDEDVSISIGKCIAEDGSTILELTSPATDLDFPTLNGGALSNSTTYHLFRYLKNDDTMQWYLDTSLTPTISDIKSALAYRRIYSAKTDASGDLPDVFGNLMSGGGIEYTCKTPINAENAQSLSTSQTTILLQLPAGLKLYALMTYVLENTDGATFTAGRIYSLDCNDVAITSSNADCFSANAGATISNNDGSIHKKVRTNTSSQIARRESSASGLVTTTIQGWQDLRNYY